MEMTSLVTRLLPGAEKGIPGEVCVQLTLSKKGSSHLRKPYDKEKFGTDLAGSYPGIDKKIIFADRR